MVGRNEGTMCYEVDHCSKCGRYVAANTSTIRQGRDGEPETVCIECLASEKVITERSEQKELVECLQGRELNAIRCEV